MNENGQQPCTMHVVRIMSTIINDYNQSLNSHTFPVRVSRIMRVGKLDFRGENDHLEHLKHAGGTHIFFKKEKKMKKKEKLLVAVHLLHFGCFDAESDLGSIFYLIKKI